MSKSGKTAAEKLAAAAAKASQEVAKLRLYIAGPSDRSTRAIRNARDICDEHYKGRFDLEVIDILQQPGRAREDHVLAVPMLIKHIPLPVKRFIGDLSNRAAVIGALLLRV
ncbi:MAG TPA: circadian clock KaiB family protein [Kofleriaceae bacterium]|jgi:circadian clock protein KaiB